MTRSKKPLSHAFHHRRHHSTMKGYENWCYAMTCVSTMVETMSKSSVRYVHQMAIYIVCNIFLFFLNSPSELTFWITYVYADSASAWLTKLVYTDSSGLSLAYQADVKR